MLHIFLCVTVNFFHYRLCYILKDDCLLVSVQCCWFVFLSQSKRSTKFVMSNAPGPGIYSLPSLLTTRKDFNRGLQGVFAAPIAEHVEKSNGIPAPNNYNVSLAMSLLLSSHLVTAANAESVFYILSIFHSRICFVILVFF